jgi:hypothetical protein
MVMGAGNVADALLQTRKPPARASSLVIRDMRREAAETRCLVLCSLCCGMSLVRVEG